MANQTQLSFLSRGPLFEPAVHQQYLSEVRARGVPQEAKRAAAIADWVSALAAAGRVTTKAKETSLEQLFNQKVLGEALGYTLYPGAEASAWPKTPTSVTNMPKEPDVMLGSFKQGEEPEFVAALELKAPGVGLDAPQASRNPPISPVEQAFEYGERVLGVKWVLVSDMRVIRLYSVESPHESLTFELTKCVTASGGSTPQFRELYSFLSRECLVDGGDQSAVARLLAMSVSQQLAIRDSFYDVYYEIRSDLITAIEKAAAEKDIPLSREELLRTAQRLLDRMLFLYYCEDNPERLIPVETVKRTTEAARALPGASEHKVYDALKALFREVDAGSPPTNIVKLPGYNGELFKLDPVIDAIDLPDTLHDKKYDYELGDEVQHVAGVWGLHVFDFWRQLNEHLLGHIFEQSLSDLELLAEGQEPDPTKLQKRKQHGIYYTSEVLSDYLSGQALSALIAERTPQTAGSTRAALGAELEARQNELTKLNIADLACGSGAFLVSSYQALLEEHWRISDALAALASRQRDLLTLRRTLSQSQLLREALKGADLLPQAVELAKLALWLRSAKKNEKVPDLSDNLVTADSLDVTALLTALGTTFGTFDLIVGNPPWGGEIDAAVYAACCNALKIDSDPEWDSWELFVALGIALLRDGGRLAIVLPDTLFSPEKERTRRAILEAGRIEYLHNLGTGWFDNVRMGTIVLQLRRGTPPMGATFRSLLLSGERRKRAINGQVPLTQLEEAFGRDIPQDRCRDSDTAEIEVFRSTRDDDVLDTMIGRSQDLQDISTRGRGEEMSKAGLLWICPACSTAMVPAEKKKRGPRDPEDAPRFKTKNCPGCGATMNETIVSEDHLVVKNGASTTGANVDPYIDGDDIVQRYQTIDPSKEIRTDFKGFPLKNIDYGPPKILIRQAGVGLLATIDATGSRVPQSVYLYRLKPEAAKAGYTLEFLLGVLLSRTIAYYIFKRFGEIDPARAHAKLTHARLSAFPIPKVDFTDRRQRTLHDQVSDTVRDLLDGKMVAGESEDMQMDVALRELWGLKPDDGLHIALELAQLPEGQVIRELYPNGLPKQILASTTAPAEKVAFEATVPT